MVENTNRLQTVQSSLFVSRWITFCFQVPSTRSTANGNVNALAWSTLWAILTRRRWLFGDGWGLTKMARCCFEVDKNDDGRMEVGGKVDGRRQNRLTLWRADVQGSVRQKCKIFASVLVEAWTLLCFGAADWAPLPNSAIKRAFIRILGHLRREFKF